MSLVVKCLVELGFVLSFINCDWIEIPQFSNERTMATSKLFFVTPNTPAILEYSPGTHSSSSTTYLPFTSEYDIIRQSNGHVEPKKSITKIPDAYLRKISSNRSTPKISSKIQAFNNSSTNIYHPDNAGHGLKKKDNIGNPIINHEDNEYYIDEYEDVLEDDTDDTEDMEEYYNDEEEYIDDDLKNKENANGFSFTGFLPYMKSIQSTLLRTSHTNTKNKMTLLLNLRDFILNTIRKRIVNLFGLKERKRRSVRTDYHNEKGVNGIEFPSNESSLLTIGFLTFSVFLIKMVLKLIHAIKTKESNYMMVAVTTASTRRKRTIGVDKPSPQELKILNILESFKYKYNINNPFLNAENF